MKLEIDIPYYVFEQVKRENTIKNVLNRVDFAIRNGVERPHGEWIVRRNKQGEHIYSVCSECNVPYLDTDFSNFCPNCGAKMGR